MNPSLASLPILILNPYSRCNCRCVMCDIWKETASHALSPECLERHLSSLEELQVKWVVLSGGEPLMHPDLFALCGVIRRRPIRITLLSAGLLLEKFAAAIAGSVDDLIVSLDGPREIHDSIRRVHQAFDRLQTGIRSIRALRPDFPVGGRCTIHRLNFRHLLETVDTARAIGLDSLSFLLADLRSTAFNRPEDWAELRGSGLSLTPDDLRTVENQVESLIRDGICGGFIRESAEKLRALVRRLYNETAGKELSAPPCNAPWVSAVVEADGTVKPCFFHSPIGKVSNGSTLLEIVNSPRALEFRRNLNVSEDAICRRCVCSLNYQPG